jgi:arsenite-transporting ATPase
LAKCRLIAATLVVTLPEATPVHEAMQRERDLARADIVPFAWVVYQSQTPLTVCDPVLQLLKKQLCLRISRKAARARRVECIPCRNDS